MKTVTKVITIASFLSVMLSSLVVTTYAWFLTQRTATVYVNNLSVYSNQGNLNMKYVDYEHGGVASVTGDETPDMGINAVSGSVTDISGDGVNLYSPNWLPGKDGSEASSITPAINTADDRYCVKFGITFQNIGDGSFDICFSSSLNNVIAGDTNSASEQAAKATRICFYDAADDSVKCLWQYDETDDGSYSYLKEESGQSAYTVSDYELADPEVDYSTTFHTGNFSTIDEKSDPLSEGQKLVSLVGHSEATINIVIWIEGTLSLATNACIGGRVSVNMKFVGI